jgi:hypothetical protein
LILRDEDIFLEGIQLAEPFHLIWV